MSSNLLGSCLHEAHSKASGSPIEKRLTKDLI